MPMIEVPLQSWKEVQGLRKSKKFEKLMTEAADLARKAKYIDARRSELSLELYDILSETLPPDTKSIEFDGATVTRLDGGQTSKFDKQKLLSVPIKCSNPKCKTVNHVTPDVIEECTTYGTRRPGISIKFGKDEEE